MFWFLQNANKCSCAPRAYVVDVVSEHLYIEMMASLRQQLYPKMRQAGRDRKISDSHRKGCFCPSVIMATTDDVAGPPSAVGSESVCESRGR